MPSQSEILKNALTLPSDERADIAAELLASLDAEGWESPEVVEAAWANEIEQRFEQIESGQASTEAWDTVRKRLGQRFQ